jgi:DNA-binding SARP family transcriptional activator
MTHRSCAVHRQTTVTGIVNRPSPVYAWRVLRIRTVGDFRVEVNGDDRTPDAFDRAAALLAWLALNPGLHTRSAVASQFWPDVLDESARASLRSALWALRRQLGDEANGALVATRDRVGLADDVWVDVAEGARLRNEGRLDEALSLTEGELLPGLEDEWAFEAREGHRAGTAELLEGLAKEAELRGDLRGAAELSRRAASLQPLSEEAHRALMRRLVAAGDRAGALSVFADLRTRMLQTIRIGPSDETRRLADCFRTEAVAETFPARLLRIDSAPFVGRAAELAQLRRLCVTGQVVPVALLAGEAGSGKTRLAARFAVGHAREGATVLYGTCAEQQLVQYEPFADALGESALDAAEIEARLAAMPGKRILVVVDDLQWADRATLALLGRLVRGTLSERLAFVAAYREDEAEAHLYRALADLRRDCIVERIELGGLETEEVAALIAGAEETSPAAPQAREIHDRTAGNPFYVRELARHVADHPRTAFGDVPEGIRDVVRARVARLQAECAEALAAAAVLGEAFDVATLAAVCSCGEDELSGMLEDAVGAGLVDEVGAGRYRFAHALTRDAVYAGLGPSRRARLHRAAAAALTARYGLEPGLHLAEIALHRCEGAADGVEVDAAVDLAESSANWAFERKSFEQAVALLTRALAVLPEADVERRRTLTRRRGIAYARLWHVLADI